MGKGRRLSWGLSVFLGSMGGGPEPPDHIEKKKFKGRRESTRPLDLTEGDRKEKRKEDQTSHAHRKFLHFRGIVGEGKEKKSEKKKGEKERKEEKIE